MASQLSRSCGGQRYVAVDRSLPGLGSPDRVSETRKTVNGIPFRSSCILALSTPRRPRVVGDSVRESKQRVPFELL